MEAVLTDSLGRRKRDAGRQSTGRRVYKKEADLDGIFLPLQRHGLLGSNYLLEFNRQRVARINKTKLKLRLGELYHQDNSEYGGPTIDRHLKRNDWRAAPYFLDEFGRQAIPERQRHRHAARADQGWFAYPVAHHPHRDHRRVPHETNDGDPGRSWGERGHGH